MNDSRPDRWRILSRYREGERTLAEWKQIFEAFPPEDFPLFRIEGSVATVVCRPGTGHPLQVFRCYNGTYSARAPAEDEVEGLDNMTVEELRLYRLDWPAHCQTVAQHLGLRGQIRGMPELPWFWRIGELQTATVFYPYFMAVIREDPDADIVGKSLKFKPEARLIVPSLSNWAFDRLTELNIRFHVLADGTPANFPAVAKPSTESAPVPSGNETPLALTKKLDAIEDKTDRVLKQIAGGPPSVEKTVIPKRARGKDGGRTPEDGQDKIKLAVTKVLELRNFNKSKSMTMERACKIVIKEMMLSIKWQALAKQVRQSPKWEAIKKRINIARK